MKEDRNIEWREILRSSMKPKERVAIERVSMPEQLPEIRRYNNREVNLGLSLEQAQKEASRCLDCLKPQCVEGCPVNIDIPGFIKNIEHGKIMHAAVVLKRTSTLPAVCGRVCPQERQCESMCIHLKMKSKSVAIGYLERFAADYAQVNKDKEEKTEKILSNGIKVAVIGSGPSGLACAGDLIKFGYDVTVFEALHEIGGVLKYGIPEFRLPNSVVDTEIDNLKCQGVKFITDCVIGKTFSIEDLQGKGYKCFFVGSGAGFPRFMNIPGENLINILSSNEYLTRVNLMGAAKEETDTPVFMGKNVAVVGGGNTAMDSARTALRLGAEHVYIVYRRSEEEMPARIEERFHAKAEGIEFMNLHNPIEYKGDDKGRVSQMVLQCMTLGDPDESGRRSPIPVEGKTCILDVDTVIVAVGVSPNPIVTSSIKGLNISKRGTIIVDDNMESKELPVIFAGGDIVRGGATVILAMGDGRKAASAIHKYLSENK